MNSNLFHAKVADFYEYSMKEDENQLSMAKKPVEATDIH